MKPYKFIKTGQNWYIDLPAFIEQGGTIGDLQMVDGADKMLDFMAGDENAVVIYISEAQFKGSDVLTLIEICEPDIGGGYYFMKDYNGQEVNQTMWLCQVTEFVFGNLPEQIFVRKESL